MITQASKTPNRTEYVIQPHAISRSIYRLSTAARKIIAMSMAQLPPDLSNLTVEFSTTEFFTALGFEDGPSQHNLLQAAVRECVRAEITMEVPSGWEIFTWISHAVYNAKTGKISLEFSKELSDFLLELKCMYAQIDLADFEKLQSFYALRYFELAKSYENLSGQNGNKEGQWVFTRSILEIRQLMGVKKSEYRATSDLRKRVIEEPIKELNSSGLGLSVAFEYIRECRNLAGIRFICESFLSVSTEQAEYLYRHRGRPRRVQNHLP